MTDLEKKAQAAEPCPCGRTPVLLKNKPRGWTMGCPAGPPCKIVHSDTADNAVKKWNLEVYKK